MPHPVVTRDPNHPDFPHGTDRGARRGCDCDPCMRTRRRVDKQRSIARAQGRASILTEEQTARVTAHVRRLLDSHPGVTIPVIAEVADMHVQTLSALLHGTQRTLRRTTANKITSVTAAMLTPTGHPADTAMLMYGQLAALGYPRTWIEKEAGVSIRGFLSRPPGLVTARFHDALVDLLDSVGDRDITRNPEVMAQSSAQAVRWARAFAEKRGYHPRVCYDDNGDVDISRYRLVVGHRWAETDDLVHDRLTYLRIITARDEDEAAHRLARALGLDSAAQVPPASDQGKREADPEVWRATETLRRAVERLRKRLRLRAKDAGHQQRIAALRDELARFEYSGEDAVAFALRNGIVRAVPRSGVSLDHPVVAEHLAAEKAKQEAA